MPNYTFKRNCKVYLLTVIGGVLYKYQLDVYPDLSFSQTFEEQTINVKTLHDQNAMFEGATINRANPANFNFTVLLKNSLDHKVLLDQLVMRNTTTSDGSVEALLSADLVIDTGVDIFRLQKCVFDRATFQLARDSLVTVSISGTASKLFRVGPTGTFVAPGPKTPTAAATIQGIIPRITNIQLDGVELKNINGITLELANNVEWLNYDTLHKSLNVTAPSDTMYPEAFVVSSKVLSGTIVQYNTDENSSKAQQWSTASSLRIRTGDGGGYYLDVNMPSVVFTNRLQTDDAFMQIYDFRMTSNVSDLTTVIDYVF